MKSSYDVKNDTYLRERKHSSSVSYTKCCRDTGENFQVVLIAISCSQNLRLVTKLACKTVGHGDRVHTFIDMTDMPHDQAN
jgi:hypothetical protein